MKRCVQLAALLAPLLTMPIATRAQASAVYVAETAAGAANGASCANAYDYTFFNTTANWGSGAAQIGPGTTVYLCGSFTSLLNFQGSGTSGHPITVTCASGGCTLSQGASYPVEVNNLNYIVLDGGYPCGPSVTYTNCTGVMEQVSNGSGLASQVATKMIDQPCGANIEIRNWLFANAYQHTSNTDISIDQTLSNIVNCNPVGATFSFHDNAVHDVGWALSLQSVASNGETINIYNNNFWNYDHAVAVVYGGPSAYATAEIHDNSFGPTANWDTTTDAYHHDGIHLYAAGSPDQWDSSWQFYLFNNLFYGDWGVNNTAYIYTESNPPNDWIFNNVFLQYSGNFMSNGFVVAGDQSGSAVVNNTFLGASVTLQAGYASNGGVSTRYQNNVISGVNTFVSLGSGTTLLSGSPSNNIYAAQGPGGNDPFTWNGAGEATFSAWQAASGGDASPSGDLSSTGLSSSGVPAWGSAVIGVGTNLTSLCSGILTALCSDTSAGGTRTPVARPGTGAWTAGAYTYRGSTIPPAPTPAGYSIVQ